MGIRLQDNPPLSESTELFPGGSTLVRQHSETFFTFAVSDEAMPADPFGSVCLLGKQITRERFFILSTEWIALRFNFASNGPACYVSP